MTDLSILSGLVATIEDAIARHDVTGRALTARWREFGRKMRRERNYRRISIRKMATAMRVPKSTLVNWESGDFPCTVAEARRAIRYFEAIRVEAPAEAIEAP